MAAHHGRHVRKRAMQAPADEPTDPTPTGWAARWGWGGLAVFALTGAVSGLSELLTAVGAYLLVVALVVLVRGRVEWARLRGRAAGGVALGTALAMMIVGGAMAEQSAKPSSSPPAISPAPL